MLARLSLTTARFVDVCFEPSSRGSSFSAHEDDEESALVVDLHALSLLFPQTPEKIWKSITAYGRAVSPLYTNFHDALASDFQNVTKILLELELHNEESLENALPVGLMDEEIQSNQNADIVLPIEPVEEKPPRKRRRSSQAKSTIVIPSTHPLAPSIIITLAPTQRHETSCRIPYQNGAFGNLLPVPCHPVFNKNHPPLVQRFMLPKVEWKWDNGRWEAILPSLAEQQERSLFSRAISSRRKPCRSHCTSSR